MFELDHLAVSCASLADGIAYLGATLGVKPGPGGSHPHMATHNRLLSLGPRLYLEVIAIDPDAPTPPHPRWFRLDEFTGPPRLTNWIVRTDSLDAALALAPSGSGVPVALQRGEYRWRMAVPSDGRLPFDDAFPALIEWHGDRHPADRLPDSGCRLIRLEVSHPDADTLRAALAVHDDRLHVVPGPHALRATIATPHGERVLK